MFKSTFNVEKVQFGVFNIKTVSFYNILSYTKLYRINSKTKPSRATKNTELISKIFLFLKHKANHIIDQRKVG